MPKFVILDPQVEIDDVDLTGRVAHVEVNMVSDDVDVSTSGPGVHEHLGGLRADGFVFTFLSDFDAAMVDATLTLLQATPTSTPEFNIKVRHRSAAVSTTTPSYETTKGILLNYSPIAGDIGARSETQVMMPSNEMITKRVS